MVAPAARAARVAAAGDPPVPQALLERGGPVRAHRTASH